LNEKKKTSPLDTSGSEEVNGEPTMKVMVDQKDSQQYKFKAESLRKMPPNMNL
jgi:hypothetical protein